MDLNEIIIKLSNDWKLKSLEKVLQSFKVFKNGFSKVSHGSKLLWFLTKVLQHRYKLQQASTHEYSRWEGLFETKYMMYVCLVVFIVRPTDFCIVFKVRRHVIGCINHDIVVGLCSELLMRLSYYIHPGCGNKNWSQVGIEPRSSRKWAINSTPGP